MNADIRIATSFFQHRKTKKLRRKQGDHGVLCLITLWSRAAIERPSGVLIGWSAEDVEIEADFTGEQGEFFEAITEYGFLDQGEDGCYRLHNWEIHQPWAADADSRSVNASKNVLFRHVSRRVPKKYQKEFPHLQLCLLQ